MIDEGNISEDEGRIEEAKQRYEEAVRLAPDLPRAHLNRGNALLARGDASEALNAFRTAIAKDPTYAAAHYNLGNTLVRLGRHGEGRAALEAALALKPDFVDAHVALACALEAQADVEGAVSIYRRALEVDPHHAQVHCSLGGALRSLNQLEAAAESYRRAAEIDPGLGTAQAELGNVLLDLGRVDEALGCYDEALRLDPELVEIIHNRGSALQRLGRVQEAITSYRRALEIDPGFAPAHGNLGNVLRNLGRIDEAVESLRRAVELRPDFAEAHYNLGNALVDFRRFHEAIESYKRAVTLVPEMAVAHCNLGNAFRDLGNLEDAAASYRRALEIKPAFAVAISNLGTVLNDLGRADEALATYRRALQVDPDFAEAHYNLATLQIQRWQFADAVETLNRAIELNPGLFNAYNNLGTALQDLGKLDDAAAAYRRALELKPDFAPGHSNLLFCLSHGQEPRATELFARHCHFGEQFEAPLRGTWPKHYNERNPTRPLRIGFVSADLRSHPVAYFVEPLLKRLSASPSLILNAYHAHPVEDHVTARLRGCFQHWHRIHHLSDAELAAKIIDDGIDILIDLSGHTAENRLLTFARKPAPVQASWIGYPGTTGLRAMDYYISDAFLLPAGKLDDQFLEKVLRLPASAAFLPDESAPPVNSLPALTNGYLTFGSFNRLSKVTGSAVELWSRLLRALPDSRLLLGGMPPGEEPSGLIAAFEREGVRRGRLLWHGRCGTAEYLALHQQVDLCLDTFPYTGGTTTNHALWMGVPTLTLAGPIPASRQGAAAMGRVGLETFVASDPSDFEARGVKWAGELAELANVRADLRRRCIASPSRQPDIVAAALERGLRTAWQRWCAGEPPASFSVDRDRSVAGSFAA